MIEKGTGKQETQGESSPNETVSNPYQYAIAPSDPSWKKLLQIAKIIMDLSLQNQTAHQVHMTLAQGRVVGAVFRRSPKGVMLKELVEELHLTASAVSQTVDALVKEGLIKRVQNEEDRRAISIHVSQKGIECKERHERIIKEYFESFSKNIPTENLQIFNQVLTQMMTTAVKAMDLA